mmetsp:Transcript_13260/g.33372  ORF Transcript_13260/g.33372 Transcript_13260/m.33372 type:complete len:636 (+) Transcript_13260:94-2001(+)
MENKKKNDAGGNDGNDSPGNNDRSNQLQQIWGTVKDAVLEIDTEDLLYYCISFISIFMLPLSAIGAAAPYYTLNVNIRPISESIHKDLNCSALNITAEELSDSVCSMDTFETKYSLFLRQVNYFHFTPSFGSSFCDDDGYAYKFIDRLMGDTMNEFGFEAIPEDTEELIGGGNIGECTQTIMLITACFAALTMGFTMLGLLWLTVLSSHSGSKNASIFHIVITTLNTFCSLVTIIVFCVAINPLREAIDPTFCDQQTSFENCQESLDFGFYCQVSTATLAFLLIPLYTVKMKVASSAKTSTQPAHHPHHVWFYKNPHFYVKLGRFAEFLFAVVSGMINFTTLDLVLPDIDETPISMSSYLWGDQFCSEKFFALDEFRLIEDDAGTSELKNFGDCKAIYKYKVIFTLLKIIISAGSALFLKRDAAKNPFIYLGGLVADFATIVLVIMAITVFMVSIYPGRRGIEPSFCDQYSELRNAFLAVDGEALSESTEEICDIKLGAGFFILVAVLPLTIANLVVEFLAGEVGSEYGAINAFQTVMKRIKRKEYQDAMFGPSSFYRKSMLDSDKAEAKFSSALESIKEGDSIRQEPQEKASQGETEEKSSHSRSSHFKRWQEKHDSKEMTKDSSTELKAEPFE